MMQITEVTLIEKNVYGNTVLYPGCETSKLLADLAGTKTITTTMIDRLQRSGVSVWRMATLQAKQ